MKPAWRAADRAAELLAAARGWRAAGLIDETAFGAIAADHASAGPRLGPIWRVLVFLCVVDRGLDRHRDRLHQLRVARGGRRRPAAADLRRRPWRSSRTSSSIAARSGPPAPRRRPRCSPRAISARRVFVLLDDLHLHGHAALRLTYPWCAAVFALAAWRWGFRLYAGGGGPLRAAAGGPVPRRPPALDRGRRAHRGLGDRGARDARTHPVASGGRGTRAHRRPRGDLCRRQLLLGRQGLPRGDRPHRRRPAPPRRASVSLLLAGVGSALYPLGAPRLGAALARPRPDRRGHRRRRALADDHPLLRPRRAALGGACRLGRGARGGLAAAGALAARRAATASASGSPRRRSTTRGAGSGCSPSRRRSRWPRRRASSPRSRPASPAGAARSAAAARPARSSRRRRRRTSCLRCRGDRAPSGSSS